MKKKVETIEKLGKFISGFELVIIEGKDRDKKYPLDFSEVILGRAMTAEEKKPGWIFFEEQSVSRMHAILEWDSKRRTYNINHKSSTNPTLVNDKHVEKTQLSPGDIITLGDLALEYRLSGPVPVKEGHDNRISSGLKFIVLEGPNTGESISLTREMIAIGKRQKPEDARENSAILLDDEEMPHEAAFLLWNDKEKNYEFFPNRDAKIVIVLTRIPSGGEEVEKHFVSESFPLQVDDVITICNTTLTLMREQPFIETGRVKMKKAPSVEKKQALDRDRKSGESHRKLQPPPQKPFLKKLSSEKAETPSPSISQIVRFTGDRTFAWKGPAGFILEVVGGPDRGSGFSILPDSLVEGRMITIGKQGRRSNDIPLEDKSIASEQAGFLFKDNKLHLVAESKKFPVFLNSRQLEPGKPAVLKSGDRIKMGKTLMEFFDGASGEKIRGYELKVIEGGDTDRGRVFQLELENSIGRGTQSDIRIHDSEVSRTHAVIRYREKGFFLEHKSTVNPTFVNGVSAQREKEKLLKPGDRIRISRKTLLEFTHMELDIDR
ncbi:MAG: FHA domain-containing protein [Chloroflexi bacterium]|nr:FHA domain-containing protein [Chloroflexota bacterium]